MTWVLLIVIMDACRWRDSYFSRICGGLQGGLLFCKNARGHIVFPIFVILFSRIMTLWAPFSVFWGISVSPRALMPTTFMNFFVSSTSTLASTLVLVFLSAIPSSIVSNWIWGIRPIITIASTSWTWTFGWAMPVSISIFSSWRRLFISPMRFLSRLRFSLTIWRLAVFWGCFVWVKWIPISLPVLSRFSVWVRFPSPAALVFSVPSIFVPSFASFRLRVGRIFGGWWLWKIFVWSISWLLIFAFWNCFN